jgi:hypothetical protein
MTEQVIVRHRWCGNSQATLFIQKRGFVGPNESESETDPHGGLKDSEAEILLLSVF